MFFSRKIPHQFYERGFLRDFAYFCESLLLLETLILCNTQRTAQCTISSNFDRIKVIMQGKLFQRCTHLLYCSVLSLWGNINTRRMTKPEMGSIFHIKNQWNILLIRNYYVNHQNYQNLKLLLSSDTKRTLMHLFLFTNSAQR